MKKQLSRWEKLVTPSIFDLIVLVMFLAALVALSKINSFDIFWHLKTGDMLLAGTFLETDVFSYTAFGREWLLHEWGSEVIFSWFHRTFGLAGLIVLRALVLAASLGVVFKTIVNKNTDILVAFAFTLITLIGTTKAWAVRPHIFTILLFCILIYAFHEYIFRDRKKALWVLPPLFIAWINLHGGFAIGFIYLGTFIVAQTANNWLGFDKSSAIEQKKVNAILGMTVLSFLLCLINPNTYKALLYPMLYISKDMPDFHALIDEWRASSFENSIDFVFLLFVLVGALIFSSRKIRFFEGALVVVFLFWALKAQRHITLFAIVMVPIVAPLWQDIIGHSFDRLLQVSAGNFKSRLQKIFHYFQTKSTEFLDLEKQLNGHVFLCALLVPLVIVSLSGKLDGMFAFGLDDKMYPTTTLEYLKKQPAIEGNIFNQYRWGGLLISRLPEKKVFIDGRMDVYRKDITEEYLTVQGLKAGWQDVLSKYGITHMLVDKKSLAARFLADISDTWKKVDEDDVATLLVKKSI